jgi:ABC-type nitrate/sulfonate/bicarbonate transport system substrate-binding protein
MTMTPSKNARRLGIALLLGSALLAPAAAQDKPKVRVGYFSQLHDASVLDLASSDLGKTVNFEYVKFQRYADAAIALARGDIDLSSLGYASIITEAAKNTEPKFKLVTGLARGAINLVCRNDVKVTAWPDLKGKTIGVVAGFPEIFLDDSLASHGQKPADVKKVNFAVAGPPVLQSLKDRSTDCAAVFEPFGATAVSGGYAYYPPTTIGDNSFRGLNNGIAAGTGFIEKNGELLRRIVTAANASTAKFAGDEQRWIDFITASQSFDSAIVKVGVKRVTLDSALYPREALTLAANMKNLGLIRSQPSEQQLQRFFLQAK